MWFCPVREPKPTFVFTICGHCYRFIKGFIYRHQPRCPENEYFLDYVRYSFLMKLHRSLPKTVLDKSWPTPPPALNEVRYICHKSVICTIIDSFRCEMRNDAFLSFTGLRAAPQTLHAEHGVEVLQEYQPGVEAPGVCFVFFFYFIYFHFIFYCIFISSIFLFFIVFIYLFIHLIVGLF